MANIYSFNSYKDYLKEVCEASATKGIKKKLAEAAGCQAAYLSQCLAGKVHLTEDHAYGASEFLGLSEEEQDYFILLVQLERASHFKFKNHLKKKIKKIREKNLSISKTLSAKKKLPLKMQAVYYSDWLYSAVHMLIGIRELQTKEALLNKLKVSEHRLNLVIEFLLTTGLAQKKGVYILPGERGVHLGSDSDFITQHHVNLRLIAIEAAKQRQPNHLQYSSTITISEESAIKIKEEILKFIQKIKEEIRKSPEEELYCFNIDFFNPL